MEEEKNDGFSSLWLRNFIFTLPTRKRRGGKQNFIQVLPWANGIRLFRTSTISDW